MRMILRVLAIMGVGLAIAACGRAEKSKPTVAVFAAASFGPALAEIAERFQADTGIQVLRNEGASSALARQIEAGAPADLFLAASPEWLDWLDERNRIERETRREVASGALVLIAPKGRSFTFDFAGGVSLADAFEGRLALGDPEHVPLGVYSRQALQRGGWWVGLAPRVSGAPDARAALQFVENGECAAGIVYATDALNSDKVEVIARVPEEWHKQVIYEGAIVAGRASEESRKFFDYLAGPTAHEILARNGFNLPATGATP